MSISVAVHRECNCNMSSVNYCCIILIVKFEWPGHTCTRYLMVHAYNPFFIEDDKKAGLYNLIKDASSTLFILFTTDVLLQDCWDFKSKIFRQCIAILQIYAYLQSMEGSIKGKEKQAARKFSPLIAPLQSIKKTGFLN